MSVRNLPLRIGGKAGRLSGTPIDADVEVTSVRTDAVQALFGQGEPQEPLGRSAAVRIGGIDVVLTSRRQQVFSPHCFTEHGIDPTQRHIVVVKSMQHFMGGFAPIAAEHRALRWTWQRDARHDQNPVPTHPPTDARPRSRRHDRAPAVAVMGRVTCDDPPVLPRTPIVCSTAVYENMYAAVECSVCRTATDAQ